MTQTLIPEADPVVIKLSEAQKKVYINTLTHLARLDGHFDESEMAFIKELVKTYKVKMTDDELQAERPEEKVLADLETLQSRQATLILLKDMCFLGHADENLSPEEVLFIGHVGQHLGIEISQIEAISDWVVDFMIWHEKGKLILEL